VTIFTDSAAPEFLHATDRSVHIRVRPFSAKWPV
jgi:hypothetical protein